MNKPRSWLFMPAVDERKIIKGLASEADAIVIDLEDGVAQAKKQHGRKIIQEAVTNRITKKPKVFVRINDLSTIEWESDLLATANSDIDGFVVPKVSTPQEAVKLKDFLSQNDIAIEIHFIVENATGVLFLKEIIQAFPAIRSIIFGGEDYASSVGAIRTPTSNEILYARSRVINIAKAFNLQATDTIYPNFQDIEGLEKESQFARSLGFDGKLAIHPVQIPVINRAFSASLDEIMYAKNLIEAYEKHLLEGRSVFSFKGKMIDKPLIDQARNILLKSS